MTTLPIVKKVTKAQLDYFVDNSLLNKKMQYKVTDKNWLLVATSANSLKSLTDVLFITNELFPSYIDADIVMLDTGVVTTNIGGINRLEIIRPSGFNPQVCYYKSGVPLTAFTVQDSNGEFDIFNNSAIAEGVEYQSELVPTLIDDSVFSNMAMNPGNLYVSAEGNTSPGFQLIIKFEKSKLI